MKKFRIRIHPLLIPFMFLFFLSHQLLSFLLLLLFVTIHELSHCIAAYLCGAKVKQIWFTPVGERAVIKNMEQLSYGKRQLILLAGPGVSFLLGGIFLLFFSQWEYGMMNLVIAAFNLLPFLPMDGGKLLLHCIGRHIGTVKTARILIKISQGFGYCLVLCGILQVLLFPFNISLLVIGFYFVSTNRREYVHMVYCTYKELQACKKRILPIKHVYVGDNISLGEAVAQMNTDYYFLFYREKNGVWEKKSQKQVMYALMKEGAGGGIWD